MSDRVDYLFEPEGSELHWDGLKQKPKEQERVASLSGPSPMYSHPAERAGLAGTSPTGGYAPPRPAPAPAHQPSPDELMAQARAMLQAQEAQSHMLRSGASTGERDAAGGKIPDWLAEDMKRR